MLGGIIAVIHHKVFDCYNRKEVIGTGEHVFDFLGTRTRSAFKNGWEKFSTPAGTKTTPNYPPVNEHYFDWIALLDSTVRSTETLRVAELGAGWAPWLVRGAFAAKQMSTVRNIEFVGVEADSTHYQWMIDHFLDNEIDPSRHHLLHGAINADGGTVKFPQVLEPDRDYGASINAARRDTNNQTVEVTGYRLGDVLSFFSGTVDFLHIDIQGAEYEAVPDAIDALCSSVKALMIGTHESDASHEKLVNLLKIRDWKAVIEYPRKSEISTDFGHVKFDDGFLYFRNNAFA